MNRHALIVEYDGSNYSGWQSLSNGRSLQQTLERALSLVANAPTSVVASGRTDAGVHACAQVVHFDTVAERNAHAWMLGCNCNLPMDIAVTAVLRVPADFHARSSAVARRYRYSLLNRSSRPGLDHARLSWEPRPLDLAQMQQAATHLIGVLDFSSFRSSACQSRSPMRRMDAIDIRREGDVIHFEFEANAFLHHQIRNLVGTLMMVGRSALAAADIPAILAARNRGAAGPTAPPQGLCFLGPKYPHHFGFPVAMCSDKARIVMSRS